MPAYQRGSIKLFFRADPTLKGYWPFDISAADESGRGFHGTLVNSPVAKIGRFRRAYNFVGSSSQRIDLGSVHVPGSSPVTILAWIRTTNNQLDDIVTGTADSNSRQFITFSVASDGTLNGEVGFINGGNQSVGDTGNGVKKVNDGRWHFVALVIQNTSVATTKMYVDGVFDKGYAHASLTYNITQFNYGWFIGARRAYSTGAFSQYFDGDICEVGVFARALSPVEIYSYYAWSVGANKRRWLIAAANAFIEDSAFTIVSQLSKTDVAVLAELAKSTTLASVIAETDVRIWTEQTALTILSLISKTEQLNLTENRIAPILSAISEIDSALRVENPATVIASILSRLDSAVYAEVQKNLSIVSALGDTELFSKAIKNAILKSIAAGPAGSSKSITPTGTSKVSKAN